MELIRGERFPPNCLPSEETDLWLHRRSPPHLPRKSLIEARFKALTMDLTEKIPLLVSIHLTSSVKSYLPSSHKRCSFFSTSQLLRGLAKTGSGQPHYQGQSSNLLSTYPLKLPIRLQLSKRESPNLPTFIANVSLSGLVQILGHLHD